jgi:iron-sulfur cluster assembly accessory protein
MANPVHVRKKPIVKQYVTKDTAIGELASKYPIAIGILFSKGMHCVGCHASEFETIRQGAEAHGMKPAQVGTLVDEINQAIATDEKKMQESCPDSPVKITEAAGLQFAKIMDAEGKTGFGLRILKPLGGPVGRFEMDFEQTAGKEDLEFDCRGIRIIVSKKLEPEVRGAVIDFRETVQGAGFTIRNTNARQ